MPLRKEDETLFGELTLPLLDALCEFDDVTKIGEKWYWGSMGYPASESDLRAISNDSYNIADISRNNLTLGSMDSVNGFAMVYPGAIYMHGAETYLVRELDLEKKVAYVEPTNSDYYTVPTFSEHIAITNKKESKEWHTHRVEFGEVIVTRKTLEFTRIRFYTLQHLGSEKLNLPEQNLETVALWLIPSANLLNKLKYEKKKNPNEGLDAVKNVLVSVFPHYVMADRQGIRGKVQKQEDKTDDMTDNPRIPLASLNSPPLQKGGRGDFPEVSATSAITVNHKSPNSATELKGTDAKKGKISQDNLLAIFLYDAYPGGLGFADKGYEMLPKMMEHAHKIIAECECVDGCPSCVRLPDTMSRSRTQPDKEAALFILEELLYVNKVVVN